LLMDLADVGGNVKDGCHIASMGGTWMMLTYGLGGMRDDDGMLSFWPRRVGTSNVRMVLVWRQRRCSRRLDSGTHLGRRRMRHF
jgi:alpha,alpha-trehalose phosphorylase